MSCLEMMEDGRYAVIGAGSVRSGERRKRDTDRAVDGWE